MGITLKDNQIVLKNGKHFYEKDHSIETYFPSKLPYERLVISGNGMILNCIRVSLIKNITLNHKL